MKQKTLLYLILIFTILIIAGGIISIHQVDSRPDESKLKINVLSQVSFGARYPGSDGYSEIMSWIEENLFIHKWIIERQSFIYHGIELTNIVAKCGSESPWIILATHYDTRKYADQDPNPSKRHLPVSGANDGASGTALLLELARILPHKTDMTIWLVFLNGEDQGNIDQWEWSVGANYFVGQLEQKPDYVVVPYMIANPNLKIIQEKFSNKELFTSLQRIAILNGLESIFSDKPGIYIIDDHLPLIEAGILSVLLIDLSYPHWHTVSDTTIDNIDFESIKRIGTLLISWIETINPKDNSSDEFFINSN